MKELKKYSLDSSRVRSENPESQNFRMFQDDGDYGPVSLPEIEIWPSGHGSSSDSDSWSDPWGSYPSDPWGGSDPGINPGTGGNTGGGGTGGSSTGGSHTGGGSSSGGTNTGFTSAERKRISTVALKYLGINERDNIELIKQWLRDAGYDDEPTNSTAWCAAFVSMVFREAQIEGRINTTRVADWRTWGKPTTKPQVGDLAFFPKGSHVGIVTAVNSSGSFQITHGNSGENNVKTTGYISNGNYTFRTKK